MSKSMNCISKIIKRRRLLKKYKLTDKKRIDQLRLMQIMKDDMEFRRYYSHIIICELRCYNRLKKL